MAKPRVKKTGECKTSTILDMPIASMGDVTRKTFKEMAKKKIETAKANENMTVEQMIVVGKFSKKLKAVLEYEKKLRERDGVQHA